MSPRACCQLLVTQADYEWKCRQAGRQRQRLDTEQSALNDNLLNAVPDIIRLIPRKSNLKHANQHGLEYSFDVITASSAAAAATTVEYWCDSNQSAHSSTFFWLKILFYLIKTAATRQSGKNEKGLWCFASLKVDGKIKCRERESENKCKDANEVDCCWSSISFIGRGNSFRWVGMIFTAMAADS